MLTRFEKTRVVSARALQISMGAPILLSKVGSLKEPYEIALKELQNGKLPLTIIRDMPNGDHIEIDLKGEKFG